MNKEKVKLRLKYGYSHIGDLIIHKSLESTRWHMWVENNIKYLIKNMDESDIIKIEKGAVLLKVNNDYEHFTISNDNRRVEVITPNFYAALIEKFSINEHP